MLIAAKPNSRIFFKIFDKSDKEFDSKILNKEKLNYVCQKLRTKKIITLKQTHSTKVVDADLEKDSLDNIIEYEGDGLITSQPNVIIAVKTADCVPVLLFCLESNIISTIHCGWRGSVNDIVKKMIVCMKQKSATNIYAIIGPSIHQKSYIVGEDFFQKFTAKDSNYAKFFKFKEQILTFDLRSFVQNKLLEEGVKISTIIDEDSFSMPAKYPSYRYSLQRNELYSGYILSVILRKS